MKATFKGKYDTDKLGGAAASFSVKAGDVRLRASMTEATIVKGPSLDGLALAVEKPGSFIIEYDVPKKDIKFQYMNSIRVAEKPLNLTYIHTRGPNRTILDGSLVIDPANKVSANYVLGTENCKLKYTYVHSGVTTLEPAFDLGKNAWDFAVSRKVYDDDVLRATYQTSNSVLGIEWSRSSKLHGSFKISATCSLAEEVKVPKITAESSWEFEM